MSEGSRIPRGIDDYNSYINNTTAYLKTGTPTNAERLGVSTEELAKWEGFLTAWNPLYVKYSDKKNGRTIAVTDQLHNLIDQCTLFNQTNHILDRIAASANVTIVDMETFNIKKGILQKPTRTIPVSAITEKLTVTLQAIGGGSVTIKCYGVSAQRAGIRAGADSVQYAYMVGTTPPTSIKAPGLTFELTTRAVLTLALGAENTAQYLYIYFRWYSTKRPKLSGPWSELNTTLIL
jgi:hypothetical protein